MMSRMPSAEPATSPSDEVQPRDIGMVAIDLDGTLLRSDKRLSKRVVRAIQRASDRGIRVVLASARPPRGVREIYQLLELSTLQINYNGALIVDWHQARYVQHLSLCNRLALRVVEEARRIDPEVCVSVEVLDRWLTDRADPSLLVETARLSEPDFVGPIDQCLAQPVTKLMLLAPPERMGPIRQMVQQRFGSEVAIFVSDHHLTQICHRDVEKAEAVAWTARHYGVAADRVMAIGDAPNDAAMLRWAGLGVAVGNAWEPTRQAADVVVPSNDEDGVAHAIERYILA